jgi:ATP-dependent Clp protease, protease subunit
LKGRLNKILAQHTGQNIERIEQDTERDNFMSSEAAVEYGLIDTMLLKRPDPTSDLTSTPSTGTPQ